MENNKQQKNTALIRIILCVAVMIILFLGIFKIVSRKITLCSKFRSCVRTQ